MTRKSFGTPPKSADEFAAEIYDIVGVRFPVDVSADSRGLIAFSYETEWKEGSTKPVFDENGNVTDYEEDYKEKKLTQAQIKKIDTWAEQNITTD